MVGSWLSSPMRMEQRTPQSCKGMAASHFLSCVASSITNNSIGAIPFSCNLALLDTVQNTKHALDKQKSLNDPVTQNILGSNFSILRHCFIANVCFVKQPTQLSLCLQLYNSCFIPSFCVEIEKMRSRTRNMFLTSVCEIKQVGKCVHRLVKQKVSFSRKLWNLVFTNSSHVQGFALSFSFPCFENGNPHSHPHLFYSSTEETAFVGSQAKISLKLSYASMLPNIFRVHKHDSQERHHEVQHGHRCSFAFHSQIRQYHQGRNHHIQEADNIFSLELKHALQPRAQQH